MAEAEDKSFDFVGTDEIKADFLETFEFHSPDQYIKTETREFGAVCPFSGLPDYGTLTLEYYPEGGKCIELKSFKYYVVSYRNVGLYQEGVTQRIYKDLKEILQTSRIKVSTVYLPRGGFTTTCVEGSL